MTYESILFALAGGALFGIASAIAFVIHGRIAGISGILGRALDLDGGRSFRVPFLFGLVGTGAVIAALAPAAIGPPIVRMSVLAVAGLLVGVGTTLANGCTSGHGICGISRGSLRSLVAVGTFMAAGMLTVTIVGALR